MSHQQGSARRRGATWTAYWSVRSDEGDRVQRSKGGFRTKGQALTYAGDMASAVRHGTYAEPRKITVAEFLNDEWLPTLDHRRSTIESYRLTVKAWLVPHIGSLQISALSPAHVQSMIATLRERGGKRDQPLSDRSVQYAVTVLRMALDHAVREGFVTRNVAAAVKRPRAAHREMSSWTAAEAQRFLGAAADDRLYAAWVLFLARGPRRGELAGLRWSDVDLDAGRLRIVHTLISIGGKVRESTPKTNAGRRSVPLDSGLVSVLQAHRRRQLEDRIAWGPAWSDTGYVFTREDGRPYHPEHFSDRFARLASAAGVRVIRLHDLRHTAATLMLEDGTPVKVAQELLGHSSPTITQALYQHVLPGMAESAGERLSGRLLGPS